MAAAAAAAAMEGVRHRTVEVNGVRLHVAEAGPEESGAPVALLVQGFPDIWYGWRHQMAALAARGFRAVAPDLRGYGDSDASSYTTFHVVGDLVALIAELGQQQVFVVGHDWGAIVVWQLCLLRPDLVRALVNLSVVYHPRQPERSPLQSIRAACGESHYICRFQELGAFCTMDWSSDKSSNKIHCWGPGPYIQQPRGTRLHPQRWLQGKRAKSRGSGGYGGGEPLHQSGEA